MIERSINDANFHKEQFKILNEDPQQCLATVLEEQEELVEALKILEDLADVYPKKDILERKTAQVRARIEKKKKAI